MLGLPLWARSRCNGPRGRAAEAQVSAAPISPVVVPRAAPAARVDQTALVRALEERGRHLKYSSRPRLRPHTAMVDYRRTYSSPSWYIAAAMLPIIIVISLGLNV